MSRAWLRCLYSLSAVIQNKLATIRKTNHQHLDLPPSNLRPYRIPQKHMSSSRPGEMLEFLAGRFLPPEAMTYLPVIDRLYLSSFDKPPVKGKHPHLRFFTVDDLLVYNAFHHDFGPLHIGHLYRFAIILHEILSVSDCQLESHY